MMSPKKILPMVICALACGCDPIGLPMSQPLPVKTADLGATDGATAPTDTCSARAKLIYIVDEDKRMSSFAPDTLAISDLGFLNCPAQNLATPFSMAVDRQAIAWVLYSSGELFKVDLSNGQCSRPAFSQHQPGFNTFGMGFVSNTAGSNDETLYVAGSDQMPVNGDGGSVTLGSVNATSLNISAIGTLAGSPELTGTGDANLWAFFPFGTPRVANINRTTAAEQKVYPLPAMNAPVAWAFAFWGGDFWLFDAQNQGHTQVQRLHATDGTISTVIADTGRTIVGAGVSTCAPVVVQ